MRGIVMKIFKFVIVFLGLTLGIAQAEMKYKGTIYPKDASNGYFMYYTTAGGLVDSPLSSDGTDVTATGIISGYEVVQDGSIVVDESEPVFQTNLIKNSALSVMSNSEDLDIYTTAGTVPICEDGYGVGTVDDIMDANEIAARVYATSDCDITFDTDHYVITETSNTQYWGLINSDGGMENLEAGKLYEMSIDLKQGTYTGTVKMGIDTSWGAIGATPWKWDEVQPGVDYTTHTLIVVGESDSDSIWFQTAMTGGQTYFAKNLMLHEIRLSPGILIGSATTAAADTHSKSATLGIRRKEDDTTHINSGYYGLMLTKGAATAEYYNFNTVATETFLASVRGRTVTLGCYLYSVTAADNLKLQIDDGVTAVATNESAFVGADAKIWVEITQTISATATEFTPRLLCDGASMDVGYVSPVMCVFGDSIGEGNYVQPPGEWVNCESQIAIFTNAVPASTDDKILNLESLSSGKVPKGCKSVNVNFTLVNSNVTTGEGILLMSNSSNSNNGLIIYPTINDFYYNTSGVIPCDSNGDIYQRVSESGETLMDYYLFISRIQVSP